MTRFTSINPADASTVWEGPATSPDALDEIIARSRQAFLDWQAVPIAERIRLLESFAQCLENRSEDLASLISREIGKPLWEARTEVKAMAGKVPVSIKAHQIRCGDFQGGPAVTRFRPHGVVAVYGPYNFPGHLPNGHICPALLAGNAIIFKPSDLAPATAERTLDIWKEAGLPNDLIQIVQGGAAVAAALSQHPQLDGLFFTGSEKTGNLLRRQFAESPGRILALELGGNNPLIVDTAHVDCLDTAVHLTVQSAFLSAGQRCTCARRLIVPEAPMADAFLDKLVATTRRLRIGPPDASPDVFMGPVVSAAAADAVIAAQANALQHGADSLLEARRGDPGTGFVTPAILDVSNWQDRPDEEVFGPFLQVIRVKEFESAIEVANDTRFGLAAGLLSDDRNRYEAFYHSVRAGIVNWNQQLTGASSAAAFGGIGASGNHRPSAFMAADYAAYPVASIEFDSVSKANPSPLQLVDT